MQQLSIVLAPYKDEALDTTVDVVTKDSATCETCGQPVELAPAEIEQLGREFARFLYKNATGYFVEAARKEWLRLTRASVEPRDEED